MFAVKQINALPMISTVTCCAGRCSRAQLWSDPMRKTRRCF